MQSGLRAGMAITLAVFLTGIVGFVTAVTPVDEERTYYDQISDLTPIVDYTAIDSYTEYNPISNITGWADNSGVTIPFKEMGVSAYIYHHYISSESAHWSNSQIYQSGMMEEGWPGSLEDSTWYPLVRTLSVNGDTGTASDQYVTLEKLGKGHYTISPDGYTASARSFSVCFRLYTDNQLDHGFTLTFERDGTVPTQIISITSISAFMATESSWWKMDTSSIFGVHVEVDLPLADNQRLDAEFITADTITSSGIQYTWLNLYNGNITLGQEYDPISTYAIYNGGLSYKSDSLNSYAEVVNNITIDGAIVQDWDSDNAFMYMSLKQFFGADLANLQDGTTVYMVGDNLYTGTRQFESSISGTSITGTFTLILNTVHGVGATSDGKIPALVYQKGEDAWYPAVASKNGLYYDPDLNAPGYTSDKVFIVVPGFPDTVRLDTSYPILEYKYIDANQFVTIADGVTGYWGNFMDSVGGSKSSTPYYNGEIILLTVPGTTIYSDTAYWKDLDGNVEGGTVSLTVPSSIPYSMALVTLDFQHGTYYAQGVVWGPIDEEDRGPTNWTLRPYQYPITPTFTKDGASTAESPSYVEELEFSRAGGTKAYVYTTYVQVDPYGKLWGNPTVYLGYYYPDYYVRDDHGNTDIPGSALRVLFSAFVTSGTSMTINGITMPVEDGQITFTYYTKETVIQTIIDDTVNPPQEVQVEVEITVTNTATMPIKGMAIDWEDGHVYLVFTEQDSTRYDIGEYDRDAVNVIIGGDDKDKDTIETDVISATGTWYWQASIYTINHEEVTVMKIDLSQGLEGWGMSLQTSMLLFVAMLILGVAMIHYFTRESDEPMGLLDWIIIGLAIFLSLGVAIT